MTRTQLLLLVSALLLAFLVTVADMPLLNVGAAFWGLICGLAISFLMERDDFATKPKT